MFLTNTKFTDAQIKNQLEFMIEQSMKLHDLTKDDAVLFVKGIAITKLPFLRKKTVIKMIDDLLVAK